MSKPKKNTPPKSQPEELQADEQKISAPLNEIAEVEIADEAPNEAYKMIEPHAPHHPVTTWKEVFIHIGVVTVGLLIAIGLEQTVEHFHHRHQVAEAHKALETERIINIRHFAVLAEENDRAIPLIYGNIKVLHYLKQHPGAPRSQWPGDFHWYGIYPEFNDSAWKTVQSTPVLEYLPPSEVRHLKLLYTKLDELNRGNAESVAVKERIFDFMLDEPDPAKLSPEKLDHLIALWSSSLGAYAFSVRTQNLLHIDDPEFAPVPKFNITDAYNLVEYKVQPEDLKAIDAERKRMTEFDHLANGDEAKP